MSSIVVGIDNGVSGTIAAFKDGKLIDFKESFIKKWLKPNVKTRASYMMRIDVQSLQKWLMELKKLGDVRAVIERSMTDQTRFHASISSHHAQEATMIALELLDIPYMTIDSSIWQKIELPGVSGSAFLKLASRDKCQLEFPQFSELIKKHGDGDAILIAKVFSSGSAKFLDDRMIKPKKPEAVMKKKFKTNFKSGVKND